MILVIGATGQLGTAIIRKLVAAKKPVRAFVRQNSNYQHLVVEGVEIVFGDLRDSVSLDSACQGVDFVLATANTVAPQGKYSFEAIEGKGYQNLISTCQKYNVKQFIYVSVPVTPNDEKGLTFRYKRINEERLQTSGLNYTIFQSSLFMDDWFALIGSTIPIRGADAATLQRRYWFLNMFMKLVGNLIEGRGVALIPGNPKIRHAFITLDDVASFMVKSLNRPEANNKIFRIGGPEILSWEQVVDIYSKVLHRKIKAVYVPGNVFRIQRAIISPFSEAASNIMALNWLVCYDTPYEMKELASTFGVSLTSVEQFLRTKVSLPN